MKKAEIIIWSVVASVIGIILFFTVPYAFNQMETNAYGKVWIEINSTSDCPELFFTYGDLRDHTMLNEDDSKNLMKIDLEKMKRLGCT